MAKTTQQRDLPRAYKFVVRVLRPLLLVLTKRDWTGVENLPGEGGFIACPNHLSHTDFVMFGHLMYDVGRPVLFLGKSSVFEYPVIGWIVRRAGQIPVYRGSSRAIDAYRAAVDAVRAGAAVAMYPEGTLTRDPDLWPMRGKTGAARVALETRCPVIPVAMWGPQELMMPYGRSVHLFPRKTMRIDVGTPVDLSDLYDAPDQRVAASEATDRIMAALTAQVAALRGHAAPPVRYDPAAHGMTEFGRPERKDG
ncbi:lysophospholipid acyltransferase family protein [Nostocoides vanveenii]|jgi:1-acyl-sn-glycerol-3-phosphate acyltransferase|uniref:Lysophospholipid acyltransferase family protein n=1 Tax=Nostocoides vanveenii TaxID=330835 RepID=A0ABP4WWW6_9MICO